MTTEARCAEIEARMREQLAATHPMTAAHDVLWAATHDVLWTIAEIRRLAGERDAQGLALGRVRAERDDLEGERASLADVVNGCLREAHIPMQATSASADLRPLVQALLVTLNRTAAALAAALVDEAVQAVETERHHPRADRVDGPITDRGMEARAPQPPGTGCAKIEWRCQYLRDRLRPESQASSWYLQDMTWAIEEIQSLERALDSHARLRP